MESTLPTVRPEDEIGLPSKPEGITAEWLTRALAVQHPGVVVTSAHIGEVLWATATKVRLLVDYNDVGHALGLPPTMWAKAGFGGHDLSADMLCFYEPKLGSTARSRHCSTSGFPTVTSRGWTAPAARR